jgi:hypothetical protein
VQMMAVVGHGQHVASAPNLGGAGKLSISWRQAPVNPPFFLRALRARSLPMEKMLVKNPVLGYTGTGTACGMPSSDQTVRARESTAKDILF